jgi:hypothetical protein
MRGVVGSKPEYGIDSSSARGRLTSVNLHRAVTRPDAAASEELSESQKKSKTLCFSVSGLGHLVQKLDIAA